jgi:hypothetical protein
MRKPARTRRFAAGWGQRGAANGHRDLLERRDPRFLPKVTSTPCSRSVAVSRRSSFPSKAGLDGSRFGNLADDSTPGWARVSDLVTPGLEPYSTGWISRRAPLQQGSARKRLLQSFGFDCLRGNTHLLDQLIVVVVEVG